jgi:hypothetical protein
MDAPARPVVNRIIGPYGPLTIADLPSPTTKRWSIRRKAEVVAAVRGGLLRLEEACSRYRLSVEEFLCWEYSLDWHGLVGLRMTSCRESQLRGALLRCLRHRPTGRAGRVQSLMS